MNTKEKEIFLCDICGEEQLSEKHKVYDENYNLQKGIYQCDNCFSDALGISEELIKNDL